jgi:lysozyme family protein
MTASNFARALTAVLRHEGGYVNHPNDPGGATNKGITIATYRAYVKKGGSVQDLKNITDLEVATVYRKHYWDAVKGDALPPVLALATFDMAVHSGPDAAIKELQRALKVEVDGQMGPQTLAAARLAHWCVAERMIAYRLGVIDSILAFRPSQQAFAFGWRLRVLKLHRACVLWAKEAAR